MHRYPQAIRTRLQNAAVTALLSAAVAQMLPAQCESQWASGLCHPGVSGAPSSSSSFVSVGCATLWDPDGAGPQQEQLILGGEFSTAGSYHAMRIARWDGSDFHALGLGLDGSPIAMTELPDGHLLVGGDFTHAGGVACGRLALWDGTTWAPFGGGTDGVVHSIVVRTDGSIVIGGTFSVVDGVPAANIAQFVAGSWSALGSGVGGGGISDMLLMPSGELVVCGAFTSAGGSAVGHVASWNGTSWSSVGTGANAKANDLGVLANGDLIAVGDFTSAGGAGANYVARWDGSSWSAFGSGLSGSANKVAVLTNGDIIVGGNFSSAGGSPDYVARWSGAYWEEVGEVGMDGSVEMLLPLVGGRLVAGGVFVEAQGRVVNHVAEWDGTEWAALGGGFTYAAARPKSTGEIAVVGFRGGRFSVASWGGQAWSELARSIAGQAPQIAVLANGDVVIGGHFTAIDGHPLNNFARWDGSTWTQFGPSWMSPSDDVHLLRVVSGGDLVAVIGPSFSSHFVWRWDGVAWTDLGPAWSATTYYASDLIELSDGDLAMAIGGSVQRLSGATWSVVGGAQPGGGLVNTVVQMPNGDIVAAGLFQAINGVACNNVAKWDGAVWSPMGAGLGQQVLDLALLPDERLVATGRAAVPGVGADLVSVWNGTAWESLFHVDGLDAFVANVHELQVVNGTDVVMTGLFCGIDGRASAGIAMVTPPCPATAVLGEPGCALASLEAITAPWTGAVYRTSGVGLPFPAFVFSVVGWVGLAPGAVPLSLILPQALPGCDLLVTPDIVDVQLSTVGEVQFALRIPPSASLVGVGLHQQMVAMEIDPALNVVSLTATNSLALTIGTLIL